MTNWERFGPKNDTEIDLKNVANENTGKDALPEYVRERFDRVLEAMPPDLAETMREEKKKDMGRLKIVAEAIRGQIARGADLEPSVPRFLERFDTVSPPLRNAYTVFSLALREILSRGGVVLEAPAPKRRRRSRQS